MTLKFRALGLAALIFLCGLSPLNDFVIFHGQRIEIVRQGPQQRATGDIRALDAKSGKELWRLSVTKPYITGTSVGRDKRASLVSLAQVGDQIVAYDDQAKRYLIDAEMQQIKDAPVVKK